MSIVNRIVVVAAVAVLFGACGSNETRSDEAGADVGVDGADAFGDAGDGGPGDASGDGLCAASCAVDAECSGGDVDACVERCEGDLGAYGEYPACLAAYEAVLACTAGLNCDDYAGWADGSGDACADVTAAFVDACDLELVDACRDHCDAEAACVDDADIEACVDQCVADRQAADDVSEACGVASVELDACLDGETCEERDAFAEQPMDPRRACVFDGVMADAACEAGGDRCRQACLVADAANDLCGIFGTDKAVEIVERDGTRVALTEAPRSFAARVDGLDHAAMDAVEAALLDAFGAGVHVGFNDDLGVLVVDGPSAAMSAEVVARVVAIETPLPALVTAGGQRVVATEQLVVALEDGADVDAIADAAGAKVVAALHWSLGAHVLEVDAAADVFSAAAALATRDDVRWAQPDLLRSYERRDVPDDPLYDQQWHLQSPGDTDAMAGTDISAEDAWTLTRGSRDVRVAIIDDGVDVYHPDLVEKVVEGYDVPGTESALDRAMGRGAATHGTAVAGVAAGHGFNGVGSTGVCPECSIVPVFTGNFENDSEVARWFAFATDAGAAVMNNSWGPQDGDPLVVDEPPGGWLDDGLPAVVEEALEYAETEGRDGLGAVIVFAAGNGNELVDSDAFASHPLTVAVAAVDDSGRISEYSDFGPAIDVSAPSNGGRAHGGIFTTDARGEFGYNGGDPGAGDREGDYTNSFGGTSSAAPTATGVIALVIAANPALTAAEVRQLVRDTADPIDAVFGAYDADGHSDFYGHGRVNAYRAVRAALGACTPFETELCNGVDDTCDGVVDEGCAPARTCEPCAANGDCSSGRCAWTPGDDAPRCLDVCDDDEGCGAGFDCANGVCVPDDGRCDDATDEVCNGVDDDLDGDVDEDEVCDTTTAVCRFDAECNAGDVCLFGGCVSACTTDDECGDSEACGEITRRYGLADGTTACVPTFNVAAFCTQFVCGGQIPEAFADALVDCVIGSVDAGDFDDVCLAASQCIPDF